MQVTSTLDFILERSCARIREQKANDETLNALVSDRMRAFLSDSHHTNDTWCGSLLHHQISTGPLVISPTIARHLQPP